MRKRCGNFIGTARIVIATFCLVSVSAFGQQGKTPERIHKLPPGGPTPRIADGHPDLSGVWFPNSAGMATDGALGPSAAQLTGFDPVDTDARRQFDPKVTPEQKPSFQPWAIAKMKESSPADEELEGQLNCVPRGVPRIFTNNPYGIKLIQTPGELTELIELLNNWRVIHTDGRPHKQYPDPTFNGESVGHWERDTLVVDVVALDERTLNPLPGWFHSDAEHIVERLSRPSMNYLVYQVTIDDPKVLAKPWTSAPRNWSLGHEDLQEYYCTDNQEPAEVRKIRESNEKGSETK